MKLTCAGGPLNGQVVPFVGPTMRWWEPVRASAIAIAAWPDIPEAPSGTEHTYIAQRRGTQRLYVHYESLIKPQEEAMAILALEERLGINPRDLREFHMPAMLANVWYCGNDVCGCTQVQVIGWDALVLPGGEHSDDLFASGWRKGYRELWRGPFHPDHESGAWDDLAELRRYFTLAATSFLQLIRFEDDGE